MLLAFQCAELYPGQGLFLAKGWARYRGRADEGAGEFN